MLLLVLLSLQRLKYKKVDHLNQILKIYIITSSFQVHSQRYKQQTSQREFHKFDMICFFSIQTLSTTYLPIYVQGLLPFAKHHFQICRKAGQSNILYSNNPYELLFSNAKCRIEKIDNFVFKTLKMQDRKLTIQLLLQRHFQMGEVISFHGK